jgi:hypothetical protein
VHPQLSASNAPAKTVVGEIDGKSSRLPCQSGASSGGQMAVERKYERDLDLLLAEEFAVNQDFSDKFKALTKFKCQDATVADFFVSKSNSLGESDLIVVYQSSGGNRFALLIEDKVDANL